MELIMRTGTGISGKLLGGTGLALLLVTGPLPAVERPLMTAEWAQAMCTAWNGSETLTRGLFESDWAANDKQRGYKLLQLYRTDCPASPRVELRIGLRDGRAECVYGGVVSGAELDTDVDYVMHATTERWRQMGAGEYGPMRAMMFGRLKFAGPKLEAMGNMGPFGAFLKMTGEVPADPGLCPDGTVPHSAAPAS
jgi:putative sterol carrier protein